MLGCYDGIGECDHWQEDVSYGPLQVPRSSFHRRHILLLQRHGIRHCWHTRALQQDASAFLHPASRQFCLLVPTVVRHGTMSETSSTNVRRFRTFCTITDDVFSLDKQSGLLHPSSAVFERSPGLVCRILLRLFSALGLVQLKFSKDGKNIISTTNLTIINMLLCIFGPMREDRLTTVVMSVQAAGSLLAFAIRYAGAGFFYDASRR